jgi:hypothetical protein
MMRVDREIKEKYFDESDTSFEARKLWYAFKDSIFYENTLYVKPGQIYYRARIIDDSCINDHMFYKCFSAPGGEKLDVKYVGKANPFKGLTEEASFVPPKDIKVSEGRANPKYVKYLYVAESPTTAIFEVRPFIYDAVNIAKIQVNEPLRVANIAVDLDLFNDKNATVEMYVMGMIQGAFSKPTNNTDDYIPTQVIAEYIKSLGYDAIRFNSSIHSGGVNLTIFNYEKCEVISSQDFRIENIKLTARAAFGSANYDGDMCYIVDNEPKYYDFSKFPDIQDDNIIKNNH